MATAIEARPCFDAEQDELALVDSAFASAFGRDMAAWEPETRDLYNQALRDVYERYPRPDIT